MCRINRELCGLNYNGRIENNYKSTKPRKSPGSHGINNMLYKHAPQSFLHKFFNFLNVCWIYRDIPEEWSKTCYTNTQKRR
jgi:hypothetical protein